MPQKEFDLSRLNRERNFADSLFSTFAPTEFVHRGDGYITALNLHREGYGIVLAPNHFSWVDVFNIMRFVFRYDEFKSERFGSAIAYHQYMGFLKHPIVNLLGEKLANVELLPVVTPHTIEKKKNQGKPLGWGLRPFLKEAVKILKEGGLVGLAPQAKKSNLAHDIAEMHVNMEVPNALGGLFQWADLNKFDRFAVMFFGLQVPKQGIHHPFKRRVLIGTTYTKKELEEHALEQPIFPDKYESISGWSLHELYRLVTNN